MLDFHHWQFLHFQVFKSLEFIPPWLDFGPAEGFEGFNKFGDVLEGNKVGLLEMEELIDGIGTIFGFEVGVKEVEEGLDKFEGGGFEDFELIFNELIGPNEGEDFPLIKLLSH